MNEYPLAFRNCAKDGMIGCMETVAIDSIGAVVCEEELKFHLVGKGIKVFSNGGKIFSGFSNNEDIRREKSLVLSFSNDGVTF